MRLLSVKHSLYEVMACAATGIETGSSMKATIDRSL
jgi:hypothetical protein